MLDTPILYIMFNRPESVEKSFPILQKVKPKTLFIACDAARSSKPGEIQNVEACKAYVEKNLDWQTNFTKIYRTENLGCAKNISSAIQEIYEKYESLIILEDDCIANQSFFPFMQDLLKKYANDERIMSISGNNFQFAPHTDTSSYYFSRYHHCWGWGSWKRAWKYYDHSLSKLQEVLQRNLLNQCFENPKHAVFWEKNFKAVRDGKLDSWNLRWTLACWLQSGLCILPRENLVTNIGFDEQASRTKHRNKLANIPTKEIEFPLIHPEFILRDKEKDLKTQSLYHMNRIQIWKDQIISLFRQID